MATKKPPAPTDAEVVIAAGTALYGDEWPARLAADLGISKEWVRNVRREHANLFPDQVEKLAQMLEERRTRITATLKMIAAWEAAGQQKGG